MAENVAAVTDQSFEKDVLNCEKPVLVDFWAPWCAPCHMISPVVEELSREYGDKVGFVKMNIDENPSTPTQLGIKGIPTLILFRSGKPVDQIVGVVPKVHLETLIQKVL